MRKHHHRRGASAPRIFYCDAPCGAGKTYALARRCIRLARQGEKVIVAQPTTFLIDQTVEQIARLTEEEGEVPVRVTVIHGGTQSSGVVSAITIHLREPHDGGEVLFVTHAAFERVPYFHDKGRWNLAFDEAPAATWYADRNIPHTHRLISDAIDLADELPEYSRVVPRETGYLEDIMRNVDGDEVRGLFQEIAAKVISPHWRVYADAEQWRNMLDGHQEKRRKVILHGVLEPSLMEGFKTVTILAADFAETALCHLWADRVTFRRDELLQQDLRYPEHENGDLITIRYLFGEKWSKNYRDKLAEDGRTLLDHAVQAVEAEFAGEPFVWLGNTDLPDDLFGSAARLPNTPHGNNTYMGYHNVALLSALLPPPAHFAFLDALGLDGEAVETAIMRSALYQAACRISIRDPYDPTPKRVIVADRHTAEWLVTKFPGASIADIDGVPQVRKGTPGRKRLHESEAVRKAKERDAKRREWEQALAKLNPALRGQFTAHIRHAQRPDFPISYSHFRTLEGGAAGRVDGNEGEAARGRVYLSAYDSLYTTTPWAEGECASFDEFAEEMRLLWRENTLPKDENLPFAPCLTDGEGRGMANVVSSWVLVLDNDGGDLSRYEFARLFPHLRMVIVNSASSRPGAERWRAFIALDWAVDADLYKMLVMRILDALRRWGYRSKQELLDRPNGKAKLCHGFDTVKLHAASVFNLPAQAEAGPEASFYDDLRDGRAALDVRQWIASALRPKRSREASQFQVELKPEEIAEFERLAHVFAAADAPVEHEAAPLDDDHADHAAAVVTSGLDPALKARIAAIARRAQADRAPATAAGQS